jgi:Asp-tRNA(Asn)/Glu-tRNA(Gln) amidotransferase A subunit family amidase
MDPKIQAWVQVAPQPALGDGPLSGIPFGAKDIMETRGLATEYGSAIYKGRTGAEDAAIVRQLRHLGATLLGKTHTTAFAYRDPPPTRNPSNPEHTPGGSSSGSAAAVAAGMVPLALGTQTSGSVLRPASYCGVTGFKPTFGLFSLDGVLTFAKSLDTLGFFTHTAEDMLSLWEAMGHPTGHEENFSLGVPDSLAHVEPEMERAFQESISLLRKSGLPVRPVNISAILSELIDAQNTVCIFEGAHFHRTRFETYGDRLGQLATLVRDGLQISEARYAEAKQSIARNRTRIEKIFAATPVILVPAATGPAPRGLSYTGDTNMNAPWTALGTPAISIPMPVAGALPLGLQLTAAPNQDARVLRTAVHLHRMLNPDGRSTSAWVNQR